MPKKLLIIGRNAFIVNKKYHLKVLRVQKKFSVLLVPQSEVIYGTGGAITIFKNFANMLQQNGFAITSICDSKENGRPKNLHKDIKFVNLETQKNNQTFSESFNDYLQKNRPNLIIFFFPVLYAKANMRPEFDDIPRILMIHSRPDIYFTSKKKVLQKLEKLYKNTTTQVLLPGFLRLLPDYIRHSSTISISNPVYQHKQKADLTTEHKKIIYLSRIDKWKGQKFLIKSFKKIANKYPDWQIDIYGDSTPKEYADIVLKDLIKKEKLEKQIFLKGVTDTPFETYLNYDFCVFPSYFEGFPLGLSDALGVGLPAIGLKGCSGVNELIQDEYNGFLCEEDENAFASAIETLICNRQERIQMGQNAIKSVTKYDESKINKQWLELIDAILNQKKIPQTKQPAQTNEFFSIKKIKSMKNYTLSQKCRLWLMKKISH